MRGVWDKLSPANTLDLDGGRVGRSVSSATHASPQNRSRGTCLPPPTVDYTRRVPPLQGMTAARNCPRPVAWAWCTIGFPCTEGRSVCWSR